MSQLARVRDIPEGTTINDGGYTDTFTSSMFNSNTIRIQEYREEDGTVIPYWYEDIDNLYRYHMNWLDFLRSDEL